MSGTFTLEWDNIFAEKVAPDQRAECEMKSPEKESQKDPKMITLQLVVLQFIRKTHEIE
jgi:hypothetical protein